MSDSKKIMDEIDALVDNKERELTLALPSYAFKYDDGERYISTSFKVDMESKLQDYRMKLMEDALSEKFRNE